MVVPALYSLSIVAFVVAVVAAMLEVEESVTLGVGRITRIGDVSKLRHTLDALLPSDRLTTWRQQ
jgi:hypothetical protein